MLVYFKIKNKIDRDRNLGGVPAPGPGVLGLELAWESEREKKLNS